MSILIQYPRSPAAAQPLEDDDLLSEILIRLPPLPSSLPRASAVCRRWRSIVSDPGFVRRFRRHGRGNPPPLPGFFFKDVNGISFQPTMDAPNRVPPCSFSMPLLAGIHVELLGCRHGLMLTFDWKLKQILVWDLLTGDQYTLAVPPRFDTSRTTFTVVGAVLRVVGDAHHFHVVLARTEKQHPVLAWIYSSETGVWSDRISSQLPYVDSSISHASMLFTSMPAVLAGDSLYWTLIGFWGSRGVLEFDLDSQSLAVIHLPAALCRPSEFMVMRTEGGGLGLLLISDLTAQLWTRNTDCDGVASWVLGRTIELDKLLSLNSEERHITSIIGFAEYNNVVFLYTVMGLFMVQLESLQVKKISKPIMGVYWCHPFESIYVAGNSMPLHRG